MTDKMATFTFENWSGIPDGYDKDPRIELAKKRLPFNGPGDEQFFITPNEDDRWPRYDKRPVPKVGERVVVNVNGLGTGTVVGYARTWASNSPRGEDRYRMLLIMVQLDPETRPEWHKRQSKGKWSEGGLVSLVPNEWEPMTETKQEV